MTDDVQGRESLLMIRWIAVLLIVGVSTIAFLPFMEFPLSREADDSPAVVVITLLLPMLSYLGLALLVRYLAHRAGASDDELRRARTASRFFGPFGLLWSAFKLTAIKKSGRGV